MHECGIENYQKCAEEFKSLLVIWEGIEVDQKNEFVIKFAEECLGEIFSKDTRWWSNEVMKHF